MADLDPEPPGRLLALEHPVHATLGSLRDYIDLINIYKPGRAGGISTGTGRHDPHPTLGARPHRPEEEPA